MQVALVGAGLQRRGARKRIAGRNRFGRGHGEAGLFMIWKNAPESCGRARERPGQ
jgi:hypothetical protein